MERMNVTEEDSGKKVVNATGDEVGVVKHVEDDKAYVDPDPGITDTIRSKLGWGKPDQEDYILSNERIHTITDDEIRLKD
ncbi:MAG: PRC-barrel domain containing protein [Halanaeroarchaeum sp.]